MWNIIKEISYLQRNLFWITQSKIWKKQKIQLAATLNKQQEHNNEATKMGMRSHHDHQRLNCQVWVPLHSYGSDRWRGKVLPLWKLSERQSNTAMDRCRIPWSNLWPCLWHFKIVIFHKDDFIVANIHTVLWPLGIPFLQSLWSIYWQSCTTRPGSQHSYIVMMILKLSFFTELALLSHIVNLYGHVVMLWPLGRPFLQSVQSIYVHKSVLSCPTSVQLSAALLI